MEESVIVTCPWCGEVNHTFFDLSAGNQSYVEDCQVCCRPMILRYQIDSDGQVEVSSERE